MDRNTEEVKVWLDDRFKRCDESGIYEAHQPIYGFRKGHCEPGLIGRYIRTYQIMKALAHLRFGSLLDAGGAEGYKAHVAKSLFGIRVANSDLSEEACKRAQGIFRIQSTPADIRDLPFKDNEFDVVLCSETLEHVVDVDKAISEIARVAGKALVITVPHEPAEIVDRNIKNQKIHGHIHGFDLESLNFLRADGYQVISRRICTPLLSLAGMPVEAMPRLYTASTRYPKILLDAYNAGLPVWRRAFGKGTAAGLIRLDEAVCRLTPFYDAILFIVLKDKRFWSQEKTRSVSPTDIIDCEVPYYFLGAKSAG